MNDSFGIPEDVMVMKDAARSFVQKTVNPLWAEIEQTKKIPDAIVEGARQLGLFGMLIPQEYGGLGLSMSAFCEVMMELAAGHSCVIELISGNNSLASRGIALDGTEEQKQTWLARIATGEILCSFALTEPMAGSDVQSISTRATRDGDGWRISGTKHFITRADLADLIMVMAVTDPEKRGMGGITAFLVPKNTPGMSLGRIQETVASDLVHQCELIFDDCFVGLDAVVGEVGFGFATAMKVIADGRLGLSAVATGASKRLAYEAKEYAKQRVTFSKPLSQRQLVQAMIADSEIDIYAAQNMVRTTAKMRDAGLSVSAESAMAKVFATEAAGRVVDRTFQIFGGSAYMKESPVGKAYITLRALRIVEGASEILRLSVAKEALA
ncbi:MAG: acyl-CoA dehydrogenase family protein [Actinobacteria bacterium]|nr:acyl-CoA dehydrogenase family protein [Actinomycetota bacterium]MCL6104636.1 acyl-CoA dehydrogenase family protein [Actinomycetota bacterium]